MITLDIPAGSWPGLTEKIRAAGYSIEQNNDVFIGSPEAQAIIDAYTVADALAAAKAEITAEIDRRAASIRDATTAGTSPAEMASWPIKRAEAEAYTADANASVPVLTMEAQARGVPVAALVARVMANSAMLSALEAQIAGVSGRHRDSVNAASSVEAVFGYDFTTGWPG